MNSVISNQIGCQVLDNLFVSNSLSLHHHIKNIGIIEKLNVQLQKLKFFNMCKFSGKVSCPFD